MITSKGTNRMKITTLLFALLLASSVIDAKESPNENKPRIEVCFVLDTTASMAGLIEGAKQKNGRSPMK